MKKFIYLFVILAFVSCQSGNKKAENSEQPNLEAEVVETTVNISGMHCDMCVASITKGVNELEGIASVEVSLEDSSAVVKYYAAKVDLDKIEEAIQKRGYTVKEEK